MCTAVLKWMEAIVHTQQHLFTDAAGDLNQRWGASQSLIFLSLRKCRKSSICANGLGRNTRQWAGRRGREAEGCYGPGRACEGGLRGTQWQQPETDRASQLRPASLTPALPAPCLLYSGSLLTKLKVIIIYNRHSFCPMLFTAISTDFSDTVYHVSDFPKYKRHCRRGGSPLPEAVLLWETE